MRGKASVLRFTVAGVLALAGTVAVHAEEPPLVPLPVNARADTGLRVAVDRSELRIGETVAVCFAAAQAGYVTLWNIGTSGKTARVFPNSLSGAAGAMRVEGGTDQCAGKAGDPFRFRVGGPPGIEDLFIVWTAQPELQPAQAAFPSAAGLAEALAPLRAAAPDSWAATKASYSIVGSMGPEPPRPAPVQNQGAAVPPPDAGQPRRTTWLLAMGANVAPLTKSNQDAAMFAEEAKRLFAIPDSQVRLYRNVMRRQFVDGMGWLKQMAKPGDLVLIYFSGHGGTTPDDDGDEADGRDEIFITYDVEGKTQLTPQDVVRDDEFAAMTGALRTDLVISVLDTCHSGGLHRSVDMLTGAIPKTISLPGLDDAPMPAVRAVGAVAKNRPKGTSLAAAREDQSALEGGRGSFFTLALIDSLRQTRGGTMLDVFANAARAVGRQTRDRQTPVLTGERQAAQAVSIRP